MRSDRVTAMGTLRTVSWGHGLRLARLPARLQIGTTAGRDYPNHDIIVRSRWRWDADGGGGGEREPREVEGVAFL